MARQQDARAQSEDDPPAAPLNTEASAPVAGESTGDVEVRFNGQSGYPAWYEFGGLEVDGKTYQHRTWTRLSAEDAEALKAAVKGQGYRLSFRAAGADDDGTEDGEG